MKIIYICFLLYHVWWNVFMCEHSVYVSATDLNECAVATFMHCDRDRFTPAKVYESSCSRDRGENYKFPNRIEFMSNFNTQIVIAIYIIIFYIFSLFFLIKCVRKIFRIMQGDKLKNLEHLRSVFDATAMGVIATDNCHTIIYINATAGLMCGVQPSCAIGRPLSIILRLTQPKRKADFVRSLTNYSKSGYPTFVLRSSSKHNLHVERLVSPLIINGRLSGTVIFLKDISETVKQLKRLFYSASYDKLTGVPNRSSFEKCLQRIVDELRNKPCKHVLVYLDLDGFKAVNDGAGHAAGDALLKELAQMMCSHVRRSDFVARIGGDEFGLILFNCDITLAKCLMDMLVSRINEHTFDWNDTKYRVGASSGIVRVDDGSISIRDYMAQADAACYKAKRSGKGQVCISEEADNLGIQN